MNKILNSPLRAQIDSLLLEGKSVYEVESWCRENGLLVSATSIKRYAETHLPNWQGNKKISIVSQPKNNDAENSSSDSVGKIDLPKIESSKEFNLIISESLKKTIVNMVTIVDYKVVEYASGYASLPKDDIGALEKIVGIFNTITSKLNEDRAGKNIFDIHEALDHDEKRRSSAGADLKEYLDGLKEEYKE